MQKLFQNQLVLIALSVFAILGFLFISYFLTNKPQRTDYPNVKKLSSSEHMKWSPAKKIILVEYSDFQCPACKLFHDYIKNDIEKNEEGKEIMKKITFVYRHFPLADIHQNALNASYAAEAAGKQGKFFEMADLMFAKQKEWESVNDVKPYFINLAKSLKLDTAKFAADMDSQEVKNRVQADQVSGSEADVNSTPSFYLDGRKIDGFNSFDELKDILKNATPSP